MSAPQTGQGFDGQRVADLGNGTFRNPIFAGDHPDPTVLRDGDDYYLTHSSFESYPGLLIWHSTDLVNWQPVGPAITEALGSVFASDLCRVDGRYYLYVPVVPTALAASPGGTAEIWVTWADDIRGPWSQPTRVGVSGYIDPGHVIGEDGRRYLFLNRGARVVLSADGMRADGPVESVYEGWRYPDDWVTEAYALEGPKMLRHDGWFYMVSAVGGTAGPATGHMVIVARSRSVHGPWEDCPANPIIRTRDRAEQWWSRGHATLVEGPTGDWWAVYHGYENGYRTLGRQTLLEPMGWSDDGWPVALGGDLGAPLPIPASTAARPPGAAATPHGLALSDDFTADRFGTQWSFYAPGNDERARARYADGGLVIAAKGTSPETSSPVTCVVGDRAYEVGVDIEVRDGAEGGLLLFHDWHLYAGITVSESGVVTYRGGGRSHWREPAVSGRTFRVRFVNDHHIVTMHYAVDGGPWVRHGLRLDTSGYDTNASVDLASLRPALPSFGAGDVVYRNFTYKALP